MLAIVPSTGTYPHCGCTETVDCSRHVLMAKAPPVKAWKVSEVIDRGPKEHYRFRVTGLNLNWRPEAPDYHFSWSVPNLDSFQYDLSDATWTV